MNQIKTVEEYRNIPENNPNKAKVGLSLPTEEFKKLSVEEKSVIFAEALATRPIEEQIAASTIAKNVLNGCCWEFVRSSPEIKRNLESFKNSKVCSVQRVVYNKKQGTYGYLVYMQMNPLCALFDESNKGPIDANDLKRACQHREEAKMGLIKKLQKGYQGRIGIFCTNDSQSITIDGKSYARVMFLVGLEHDNYNANLKVATDINNLIKAKYPSLTRGIYKKSGPGVNGIYNQDFNSNCILIELGGQYNTMLEVSNTIDILAKILYDYIGENI